jgi:hypothetical protein
VTGFHNTTEVHVMAKPKIIATGKLTDITRPADRISEAAGHHQEDDRPAAAEPPALEVRAGSHVFLAAR